MSRLVGWVACSACGDLVSRLASHDGRCIACSLVQARRQAAETMRERSAAIADAYKGAGESGYATAHHIADEIRALGVTP